MLTQMHCMTEEEGVELIYCCYLLSLFVKLFYVQNKGGLGMK